MINFQELIEQLPELTEASAKRIVRINSKGKRSIKKVCPKGMKRRGTSACQVITGRAKVAIKLAHRKASRTLKRKGAGFRAKVSRKRAMAMRRRKTMVGRRR